MTNRGYTTLYTGMTNNVVRRVWEHKNRPTGFVKRYRLTLLVHMEHYNSVWDAIIREKQIKDMDRAEKIELIEESNPSWYDLSAAWASPTSPDPGQARMTNIVG